MTAPWWASDSTRPLLAPAQVHASVFRTALTRLGAVAVLTGSLAAVLTLNQVPETTQEPGGLTGHKQTSNALEGGCGPEYSFEDPQDGQVVPRLRADGTLNWQSYPNIVPMAGAFWETPAPSDKPMWRPEDKQPPVPENFLNNQWHGGMVLYYDPDLGEEDVDAIEVFVGSNPELGIIAAPWTSQHPLPSGRSLAFATWNAGQSCHVFAPDALRDFRAHHPASAAPGAKGTPPAR